ncbi:unnamed protein product [Clonostachys rosea]|uniref:Uncharacterized protein n=1 Tax=Bionectria ochroleuca TaxID=29856 RepID=A0ABY6TX28_BIOOC|nr:unnamed protein product [Clonostachys rosea]
MVVIKPFSQETLEMVALLVSLKTIEVFIDEIIDNPSPDVQRFFEDCELGGMWGNWWLSRFPQSQDPTLKLDRPHYYYTGLYMYTTLIHTRGELKKSIEDDPDRHRHSRPFDDVAQDEHIMPALRSMRELASRDLSCFEFVLRVVMKRITFINQLLDPYRMRACDFVVMDALLEIMA